ncbi:MAG: fibronectin type III domain-containing protein, partial [Actinobacteria bacterium]|nr:fibronectin type III domain-containing protein [Actinomycetota bacterium]
YEVLRGGVLLAMVTATAYVDGTAQQGVSYTYSVRALDAAGNRGTAASVQATVRDVVPPSAPGSVTALTYTGPTRIRVAWSAAADNVGATGYRIYRNSLLLASTSSLAYVDYGVVKKTTYTYSVRAVDAAGNLGASSAVISVRAR